MKEGCARIVSPSSSFLKGEFPELPINPVVVVVVAVVAIVVMVVVVAVVLVVVILVVASVSMISTLPPTLSFHPSFKILPFLSAFLHPSPFLPFPSFHRSFKVLLPSFLPSIPYLPSIPAVGGTRIQRERVWRGTL
jgi:hypothetical protein